jgi:hypothetical protein
MKILFFYSMQIGHGLFLYWELSCFCQVHIMYELHIMHIVNIQDTLLMIYLSLIETVGICSWQYNEVQMHSK